ncbi:hypothetical protein [Chenggangzhangella methanolivorans]|uniref:Uncharacterized protein n=1 Tax=Chenggangzhangella methanolivorans TaxID=1437009 RepID=A0A9E6RA23_9HYPH|nr:hypothetical protein [Chenggangzhangella methanolivorans]QZO00968.1 hypothetical protein K6K41_04970 [Chenggangzhangella methanolivorans]
MPHDHSGHDAHDHHAHGHHHGGHRRLQSGRPAPDATGSLLRASAAARLSAALAVVALVWGGVLWVVS